MIEEKKVRLKGFAKIVAQQVEPLNTIEKFKQDFKDKELKILLNAKDGKYAALLVIEHGKIYVEGIENEPKSNIKKEVVGWDGLLETKTQTFVDLLGGENLSMGSIIWKILTFRIKIKSIKNVLVLLQLFKY
ncbi:MAG: hypothetical protein EAX89_03640 [Candidatus Lokiarchaeota archaeon]|nr:hypothetical protein [Candidatus Lokiarchaeota archaeon]